MSITPGPKNLPASVVTTAPSVNHCWGPERRLAVKIIPLDIEEPHERRRGPIVRSTPGSWSTPVRAAFSHIPAASSASLPVSIASSPTTLREERVPRRKQPRLFKDVVPDALPADLEQFQEPVSENLLAVEWTQNCLLPPGVRKDQLKVTYRKRQPALQADFIWG